jgi:hypothetical protein
MAVTVVLAVGLDSWLLATENRTWRSAGCFVVSAESIAEAIRLFNDGDFDLVVVGDCISVEKRERLTSMIRTLGSQTPVAFIGNSSHDSGWFADSTPKNDSGTFLERLRELLADQSKMRVVPTILHSRGSPNRQTGAKPLSDGDQA